MTFNPTGDIPEECHQIGIQLQGLGRLSKVRNGVSGRHQPNERILNHIIFFRAHNYQHCTSSLVKDKKGKSIGSTNPI